MDDNKYDDVVSRVREMCDTFSRKKIVFANGCFDVLHVGHLSVIQKARSLFGDESLVVIAINSDDSVRRLKGHGRPINNAHDRATMLASLVNVDIVLIFDEDDPGFLIKKLRPDVIVKGAEYAGREIVGSEIAQVVLTEMVEGYSTTALVSRMRIT